MGAIRLLTFNQMKKICAAHGLDHSMRSEQIQRMIVSGTRFGTIQPDYIFAIRKEYEDLKQAIAKLNRNTLVRLLTISKFSVESKHTDEDLRTYVLWQIGENKLQSKDVLNL